jgi:tetratricopeptide (TPR) repeat protein
MGKTSAALHVLHHPDVVARYGDRRYFVGCDAIGSAETLATLILQVVRIPSAAGDNDVTVLHRALLSAPLTLLLLDNFETVWEINSRRDGVVDLLQKVVNAKNISLIITMRGTIPPLGIAWTRFGCLPQLSPLDAKRLFLAINPSLSDGGRGDAGCLDRLLEEMDYVPLAVRLLAQISIGFSSQYMLKRWNQEKTAMLRTHEGPPGKLESIEVSISLSLTTLDIRSNPATVQLLVILCQLPDGLHRWEERLPIISTGLQNIHHLVYLLRKTALVFIAGSSLKVLSPIRHFIHRHHDADPDHIRALESYFWDLVHTHATVPMGPDFPRAKEILEPDMGNICSLIKSAAQIRPSRELVEIVLDVSRFQYFAVPSTEFLRDMMPLVKHVQTPTQEAQMLQRLGDIFRKQDKYTEASVILTGARGHFLDIDNILGAAQCSRSLGGILYMQSKYPEAYEILTEARQQLLNIGNVLDAALCSLRLGDILRMHNKYTEASATLTEARRHFLDIGNILGAAQGSRGLGDILYMQSKYTEAYEILIEARQQLLNIGNVFDVALCSLRLGDILRMQDKYTEASATLTEARRHFLDIGNILRAAQCSRSLCIILHMQSKYTEASEILTEARQQFLDFGNVLGAAQCSQIMSDILYMQAEYTEASQLLTEAQRQFLDIGDILGAAQCLRGLGDILRMQHKYTEAYKILSEARRNFLDIGHAADADQCSIILDKINREQGLSAE